MFARPALSSGRSLAIAFGGAAILAVPGREKNTAGGRKKQRE
jgi:hypothetical protein